MLGYNKLGQLLGDVDASLTLGDGWKETTIDGRSVTVGENAPEQAGTITAQLGDVTSTARLRAFPKLPWKWDFEGYTGKRVPSTWINAFLKLQPKEIDGSTVLESASAKGRPSANFWLGVPEMKDYTVQADVRVTESQRKMANIGLTAQRYNFILKANTGRLAIQSWAPHLRMGEEVRFRAKPDTWYTIKMTVQVKDDGAHVLGKAWERGKEEPAEWSLEAVDPHPNLNGSPGLYVYNLADSCYDNVIVSE